MARSYREPTTVPYVHASGHGPPAVLVHGTFVGGPQSFAAQAPLAEDHRLLIVDAPTPDPAPSRLPLGARHPDPPLPGPPPPPGLGGSRKRREVVNRSYLPGAPIRGDEQTEGELVATVDGRVPPGPRGNLLLGSIPEIRRDNVHAFLGAWREYGTRCASAAR
jgi:hypothetical protein